MNSIFGGFLRKFVLVFFDDILIYSASWKDHLQHLQMVFHLLQQQHLFLKKSKCSFAQKQVAYLGHVVTADGVSVDEDKIAAILRWPQPTTVRALRGFLGLTGYYRKFVQNYGIIVAPLTNMLKKQNFQWTEDSLQAFNTLKKVMTSTPVLALPDFSKSFIIECDASESGLGAVLQQQGCPIAFFSSTFAQRHRKLPAYEKELIGLTKAVRHWHPYFWGNSFIVRTDHYSLKFLLEQRISTSPQQQWISKLMGYDFKVEYKAGKSNIVADALSRQNEEEGSLMAISKPQWDFLAAIRESHYNNSEVQRIIQAVRTGEALGPWEYKDGILWFKSKLYLPPNSTLATPIIAMVHNSCHEGYQRTLHRLSRDFYWPGMKRQVQEWVSTCSTCQRNKTETLKPAGLLQPLPIPHHVWTDISMDFIEGLPNSHGKNVLLVVVDRFSKYAHFLGLSHPYTAVSVAKLFFDNIFKLHGLPETIVSDRDVIFTSSFWQELFRLSGTKLCFSSAYHPQSDGQTEAVNRIFEMYLRCFTGEHPKKWFEWLAWA